MKVPQWGRDGLGKGPWMVVPELKDLVLVAGDGFHAHSLLMLLGHQLLRQPGSRYLNFPYARGRPAWTAEKRAVGPHA